MPGTQYKAPQHNRSSESGGVSCNPYARSEVYDRLHKHRGIGLAAAGYADRRHEPGTSKAHERYVSGPQQEQARAKHP